jgi:antitoxin component YwqK of YwqJK toxin-antitoxin module
VDNAAMHFQALFVAALLALANASHAQIMDCDIGGQSVNPNHGGTTAGKTGLMRCVDRQTRELLREEELRDGRFVGVKRWYEKGQLRREYSVNEKGNRDGRSREWNAQGVLVREGFDANSASVGLHREWFDSGKPMSIGHWGEAGGERRSEAASRFNLNRDGQLTDLRCGREPRLDDEAKLCGHQGKPQVTELFTDRGYIASRVTYERGQLLRHESYWDDGKLRFSEESNSERRVARQFSRDGVLRKQTERRNGQRVLEQDYSERGTLVAEKRWAANGALEREDEWYLNGQPKRSIVYSADSSRIERSFHDNGKPSWEARYVLQDRGRGVPSGAHKTFDESGRLRVETIYDDKGWVTRERSWDDAGRVQRDDEVFEDGSRKAYGARP